MLIRYFTEEEEYANKTRDLIPRIGEKIRFRNVVYKIEDVVWVEDETQERVHIFIKKMAMDI